MLLSSFMMEKFRHADVKTNKKSLKKYDGPTDDDNYDDVRE